MRLTRYAAAMSTFIGHNTALTYLRRLSRSTGIPSRRTSAQLPEGIGALPDDLDAVASLFPGDEAIDLLASQPHNRLRRKGIRFHVWSSKVPPNSFIQADSDTFVSSPEFCFLQMAGSLTMPKLIQLGYELCGCYIMDPKSPRGFERTRRPMTTPLRIHLFLQEARGCYGYAKAMRALRWVIENAWSPMEADTTILLTLPARMGGYQLPFPLLNAIVRTDGECFEGSWGDQYRLDCLWGGTRTALEFNGEDHLDKTQAGKDRIRELALGQMKYKVITITARQVFNLTEFDLVVQTLCKALKRRYRRPTQEQMAKKVALRRELFERLGPNVLVA